MMNSTGKFGDCKILCVGLACVDLLVLTREYPTEDSDSRTISQQWQRGGNASNNCTVLSYLGASCELLATLNDADNDHLDTFYTRFLQKDLQFHGICFENCVYHPNCGCPTSVVILNSQNGSRTILHQKRELPELSVEDFKKLDLKNYKWIHFEGRHPEEYSLMLKHVHEWNMSHSIEGKITVSVELEKPQLNYKPLSPFADYIFVSKDLAVLFGFKCKEDAARSFALDIKPGATVICPWGDDGVAARASDGAIVAIKAYCPPKIVDTLGAGDTFNAATIFALANGLDLSTSLSFGCRLAGEKCGMLGYTGLKEHAVRLYNTMVTESARTLGI